MIADARSLAVIVPLLLLCCGITPAFSQGQPRTWFASINYESSNLLVPVIIVAAADDGGREWSVGLTGWTISADWKAATSGRRKRHIFVRLTPVNANSSNLNYQEGVRDRGADYRSSAIEGGAGVEIAHARRWTGGYRVLTLYQRVDGMADSNVSAFWRRPFGGLEVVQRYTRV